MGKNKKFSSTQQKKKNSYPKFYPSFFEIKIEGKIIIII